MQVTRLSMRGRRLTTAFAPARDLVTKRPPVSSRRTLIAMTRKHETHSPGKTIFLVIWWMSKNPYAAVFENRIAAEAAANVRNAILVTFAGKGTEVEAVVDWFRRDDEGRPMPAEWRELMGQIRAAWRSQGHPDESESETTTSTADE